MPGIEPEMLRFATAARCATNELYMYAYPLSCTLRLWLSDLWWTSRRGIMWWHPGRGGWAAGYTVSDLWWTSRRGRMWWDSGRGGWAAGYIWPVMNQPQRKNVMRLLTRDVNISFFLWTNISVFWSLRKKMYFVSFLNSKKSKDLFIVY